MNADNNNNQGNLKILIVEDSPTQAEQLRNILEPHNYRVTIAKDGRQALDQIKQFEPTLVISDIVMPEINGYQLCQAIKADASTRAIPVILLTGLSDEEDILEGLACGADSFITKPYSAGYLLNHIERTLANQKTQGKTQPAPVELSIQIRGEDLIISTHPQQMLSLMFSTYGAAVQRNTELAKTQEELSLVNERLEDMVGELTGEIAERERLQAELHKLSVSDELTGLHNRRGFMMLAEQHMRFSVREKQEFIIVYADMNNLKKINDNLGHAQGDRCLQDIARIMKQSFRDSDILARIGGDEFTALFANCDLELAHGLLSRLTENLEQANKMASELPPLSVSVGLAQFNPDLPTSINELLQNADSAMYIQKQQFRDKSKV